MVQLLHNGHTMPTINPDLYKTEIYYRVWFADENGYSRNVYRKRLKSAANYGKRQFDNLHAFQVIIYMVIKTTYPDGTYTRRQEFVKSIGLRPYGGL